MHSSMKIFTLLLTCFLLTSCINKETKDEDATATIDWNYAKNATNAARALRVQGASDLVKGYVSRGNQIIDGYSYTGVELWDANDTVLCSVSITKPTINENSLLIKIESGIRLKIVVKDYRNAIKAVDSEITYPNGFVFKPGSYLLEISDDSE